MQSGSRMTPSWTRPAAWQFDHVVRPGARIALNIWNAKTPMGPRKARAAARCDLRHTFAIHCRTPMQPAIDSIVVCATREVADLGP